MEVLESKYSEEKKGLLHDIEEFPISRKDTSGNQTGTWRTLQPLFEEAIAPCSQACPANANIPEYMALVREGNLMDALKILRLRNPLPGLWGSKLPDWGYSGEGVFDGLKVLREINAGNIPDLGRRVVVVGCGNTALDVTRVLMRLNKEVVIVYRRTMQEAPAFEDEIEEGLEEQTRIMERSLITRIEEGEGDGLKIEIQGVAKKNGEIVPRGPKGHRIVDSVIAALGQMAEMNVEEDEKIILGGDFETGAGTVAQAIGSGREGAFTILERLGLLTACGEANSRRVVNYDHVNPVFFKRSERFEFRRREPYERTADFNEVVQGASMEEALAESNRCFYCGTCTLCGACWYFCPDACVIASKNGPHKIVFDLDFCKGCAICSVSCPRGCVVMEEEQ